MLHAMGSPIFTLPPELLTRVFAELSEDKSAIEACRLTCSTLSELSTPFLTTRVVYANRLKTITRLLDIANHPVFSKYVTELLYDASWYNTDLAFDLNRYVERCFNSRQRLIDSEYIANRRADKLALSHIKKACKGGTSTSDTPGIRGRQTTDSKTSGTAPGNATCRPPETQVWDALKVSAHDAVDMMIECHEIEPGLIEDTVGCYKGIPEYRWLSHTHDTIEQDKLPVDVLAVVFSEVSEAQSRAPQ
jgi:hypothetical protein